MVCYWEATHGTKVDASVVVVMQSGFGGRFAITIQEVTVKKF